MDFFCDYYYVQLILYAEAPQPHVFSSCTVSQNEIDDALVTANSKYDIILFIITWYKKVYGIQCSHQDCSNWWYMHNIFSGQ